MAIRYLATGESYTSLSCQVRVGRSTLLPEVWRAIQDEFTREYLKCPATQDEWKELNLYHNYKGFFSIAMLAVVDGQYNFRWLDAGTVGSCSDAQIFNASQLKTRIEDGRIGFPDPAPITQGGPDVPHLMMMCLVIMD